MADKLGADAYVEDEKMGKKEGSMSRFFTDDPSADTYANAEDKATWKKKTYSGRFDSQWRPSAHAIATAPPGAGSMCPVEYGGSHVPVTTETVAESYAKAKRVKQSADEPADAGSGM